MSADWVTPHFGELPPGWTALATGASVAPVLDDLPLWLAGLARNLGAADWPEEHLENVRTFRANLRAAGARLRPVRAGAVLVAFAEGPEGPDVLLLERAASMRSHPGQTAFPGGAVDDGDASVIDAALREAREETGLVAGGVLPFAMLAPLPVPVSSFEVVPVLGWWHTPVAVAPGDPGEVARVARVPLTALSDPANRGSARVRGNRTPAFDVAGLLVWGFTAWVLDVLLRLGGWEQPWDRDRLLQEVVG